MSCDSGRVLTFSINLLHYFLVVFDIVESYAPGFKDSVIGRDILTPPDLEKTFGLTGGVMYIELLEIIS